MEIDTDKVEKAAAAEVANFIFNKWDWAAAMNKIIDTKVAEIFEKTAEKKITETVEAAVTDALNFEYRKTNGFGQQVGEPTTISVQLQELVTSYWTASVDDSGKPTDSQYHKKTRAEWMMLKICGTDFLKDLEQHAVNATAQLKDGLRAELKKTVDKSLDQLFRVRSADDAQRK